MVGRRGQRVKEKRPRGERSEGCVLLSLNRSLTSHVKACMVLPLVAMVTRFFPFFLVADQYRDSVGGNTEYTTIILFHSSKYSEIKIMSTSPVACAYA